MKQSRSFKLHRTSPLRYYQNRLQNSLTCLTCLTSLTCLTNLTCLTSLTCLTCLTCLTSLTCLTNLTCLTSLTCFTCLTCITCLTSLTCLTCLTCFTSLTCLNCLICLFQEVCMAVDPHVPAAKDSTGVQNVSAAPVVFIVPVAGVSTEHQNVTAASGVSSDDSIVPTAGSSTGVQPMLPAPGVSNVLNVRRHPPTGTLRGVNVFQVDSETGYIADLELAPYDSPILKRFRALEEAEGRNHSAVVIQVVNRLNPADVGANRQPTFVSSVADHTVLPVHPFGYRNLLAYLVSPKYIDIRSRIHQYMVRRSGPLSQNFDQRNFVTVLLEYPASQSRLVVKTILYKIGGLENPRLMLINLMGYCKNSWNLESISGLTDYMHLPITGLLAMASNPAELSLARFFPRH
jgi:hypothetical protein